MQKLIARFQDSRPLPPAHSERLVASEFQREIKRPSKYAPGVDVVKHKQTCPSCASDIAINHGDRIRCGCGLFLEMYGNCLTVWRKTEHTEQKKVEMEK